MLAAPTTAGYTEPMSSSLILNVALPVPMRRLFDYRCPESPQSWPVGARVRVPFGRRQLIGIIVAHAPTSELPAAQLKAALELLDEQPLLDSETLQLLQWAAHYYQHPLGDALLSALPVRLRNGDPATPVSETYWQLSAAGQQADPADPSLGRAPAQRRALQLLHEHAPLNAAQLNTLGVQPAPVKALQQKGLVETCSKLPRPFEWTDAPHAQQDKPRLNADQAVAVGAITASLNRYQTLLLEGVTGSGKTEVYLQAIEPVLAAGQQVLVLVPEIGLTPQTLRRFERRFQVPIAVMHSGLSEGERLNAWLMARQGSAAIIIGTRSAIFTPIARLGLIIVDEEHDLSFKQQDGWRYHARDIAVSRAHRQQIPLVLGSATPALESLNNALQGRYTHLRLPKRAGKAEAVRHRLIDVKARPLDQGLSPDLISLIRHHLDNQGQVLLFLNRRGYSPTLICHECGWLTQCPRCDAYMTYHRHQGQLHCHHCDTIRAIPPQCPDCGSTRMVGQGVGTEQLEEALLRHFPDHSAIRIDRDSTRRKGELDQRLGQIRDGEHQLLIGTQMLAKGHHFPKVTLVAILDVDGALFSVDFRAPERLAQLIDQVAGRAGRADKPGTMVLQTHHPEHYLLQDLLNNGYAHFARTALQERQQAQMPPFRHWALIRAEALNPADAEAFLRQLAEHAQQDGQVEVLGPFAAPMERKAGRYRFQLLFEAEQRPRLQHYLQARLSYWETLPLVRKIRWSVDVDPQEMS